jgi:hypothetical protein
MYVRGGREREQTKAGRGFGKGGRRGEKRQERKRKRGTWVWS